MGSPPLSFDWIKVFEDNEHAGDWRVEYFDAHVWFCDVTFFACPLAEKRALLYHGAPVPKMSGCQKHP